MTDAQQPSHNEWLQTNITPSFLATLLFKAERRDLETEVHRYLPRLLHRGTRSEVYTITIPPPVSSQNSCGLTVVLKRYLPPAESVQMRAGLAPPSDEHKPVDQHEYINLLHFKGIVPNQIQPYLHDPERHVVVMELLKGGDFDTRLTGFYNDFLKAARKKPIQIDIKQRIVQDLDILLSRAHRTMFEATQFALVNPNRLVLLPLEKRELHEIFDARYNALHPAASNIILSSLLGHKPEFIIQSNLTKVADNNRLTSWIKKHDYSGEREKLIAYLMKGEGIVHHDLRPENVLIRSSEPSLETVLGDLTDIGWGPVDQDMVTLLMDSRLKKMFTLQERRAIYDRHLEDELLPCYDIAKEFQTPKDRTLRFSIAAINVLLSDIRFTVTYPQQVDPARSLATGGSLEAISTSRRFPLPDLCDHFTTQFLSLAQILSTVKEEFPRLFQGVISFYPLERRGVFQNAISNERRQGIITTTLSKLFEKGKILRQQYPSSGFTA